MTTGTDEHGVNVERSAKKAGVPESEFVAKMAARVARSLGRTRLQGDEFIRTTDLKHARTVQWLFKLCRENGFVYKGHYTGQYCIYDNAYVDDASPARPAPIADAPRKPSPKRIIFSNYPRFRSRFSISTPSIRISFSPKRAATKFSASWKAA